MSFEFVTGFEEFSNAVLESDIFTCDSIYEASIVAAGRRGGDCLRFYSNDGYSVEYHYRAYSANSGIIVLGMALKVAGATEDAYLYLYFTESTYIDDYHARILFSYQGLTVYNSLGAVVASYTQDFSSDFVYVEVKLDCSGSLQVRILEELVIDLTGETFDASSGIISHYGFYASSVYQEGPFDVDDFYVDTESFNGDLAILWFVPASDVAVDFTPSTGSDNYALVDDPALDVSDYVESALVGDKDVYGTTPSFGFLLGDVIAVNVVGYTNVPDGGVGSGIIPKLKISGTEYDGTQVEGVTITKRYVSGEFLLNPATGAAFTRAEIEALDGFGWEIGE